MARMDGGRRPGGSERMLFYDKEGIGSSPRGPIMLEIHMWRDAQGLEVVVEGE